METADETGHGADIDQLTEVISWSLRVAQRSMLGVSLRMDDLVTVDAGSFQPKQLADLLLGDASKAKAKLGWSPRVTFDQLVEDMVRADLELMRRDPEA
ncbi:hypothetical protein MSG28_004543 [Choristoneura fumiferana]|uniref:Uncharacterized protein n=1 Tax=Choristoneura fumiferana TaxID=7141 RepID=A0ACC0K6L5_CHOFU|nr:hypothetical protein MSG28_004543 [Choristoneura fumiferana]